MIIDIVEPAAAKSLFKTWRAIGTEGTLNLIRMLLQSSRAFTEEHFKPAAELVNAVMVITAIGMGADTLDKFTSKKAEPKKEEELG